MTSPPRPPSQEPKDDDLSVTAFVLWIVVCYLGSIVGLLYLGIRIW